MMLKYFLQFVDEETKGQGKKSNLSTVIQWINNNISSQVYLIPKSLLYPWSNHPENTSDILNQNNEEK